MRRKRAKKPKIKFRQRLSMAPGVFIASFAMHYIFYADPWWMIIPLWLVVQPVVDWILGKLFRLV